MTSSSSSDAEESPKPRAIIVGHGEFPHGLVNAVQQICGRGALFLAVTNQGLSGQDVESSLRDAAAASDILVFFTDLPGGSATLAVRRMMRIDSRIVLVTGTNLATLLEFVFQSDDDPRDAARRAAEKGRAALDVFGGT